jgi:hypothetical protein
LDCAVNPATGALHLQQGITLLHHPPLTLFVTDAFWNYHARRVPA